MSNVEAKIRINGKTYGVLVDFEKAIAVKEGRAKLGAEVLAMNEVFSDIKKGMRAGSDEVMNAFGTNDIFKITERVIKNGELQIPADYKNKQREDKVKQVIDFISRNAVDPKTGRPHTIERVKTAIEQAGVNVDNRPIEEQITHIMDKLKVIIPLKMETKKIKVTIPASYSGRAYSIVKDLKEKEEWLNNGDLLCVVNVPAGMQMDFYDKLNGATHGAAIAEEIK
ncbi:MAG: ribosome assembly factor SBDS [Nanoarchaeota archaeon]